MKTSEAYNTLNREELIDIIDLLEQRLSSHSSTPPPPQRVSEVPTPTALSQKQQRLLNQFTIDNLPESIFWLDDEGRIVYVNEGACNSLGHTRKELLKLDFFDISPETDIEAWPGIWEMVGREKRAVFESIQAKKDGTHFPVEITAHLVEMDNVLYCCAFARDITAQKSADRFLQLTKFSLDNAADAAYWIRSDGSLIYVNEAACKALGYSREALIKKKIYDINQETNEGDWSKIWDRLRKKKRLTYEMHHRRKDGQILPVEISANLLEFGGEQFSCEFVRNITARKEAEAAIEKEHAFVESLIETAPVIVLVLDNDGCILRFNSYMETVSGYTLDEVLGEKWVDSFVPDDQKERVNGILNDAVVDKPHRGDVVYSILTKRAALREIIWYDTPLRNPDGQTVGLLSIGQDITERQAMEFRLKQKEKMEAIGQLAGGIAHDFNNQLAGILAYADLLQEELINDRDLSSYVNNIIVAIKRSSDLTNQLLAFSRKGKFLTKPVDLHRIVDEVITILSRSIDKRILLKQQFQARQCVTIGDPSQLQNAILNLAINARDAMPDGGQITFATAVVELDKTYCKRNPYEIIPGNYVLLTVADNGVGMDTETQQHIFEPFFTTKDKGKGTGMGMAAVYGTVKNHKGAINVYSEPNKGTVVKIFLPLHAESIGEDDRPRYRDSRISGEGMVHVLVVEDETIIREAAKDLLHRIGCKVSLCENGEEALSFYRQKWKDIDIVILDMVMPKMNGRDAFLAMKGINPKIRAILASGYSLDGEAQSIIDDGVMEFLQKPFRRSELAHKIESLLIRK